MLVWVRLWYAVFSGCLRFKFIHMTNNYKICIKLNLLLIVNR